MKKPFGMFIDLIYYGGYFERGYYNKEEFPAKPLFVLKLLKASVEKPGEISFSRSSINGFIGGNSITAVGKALMEAGYKEDKLSDYIKSLYKQEHKKTKPYNEKYGAKLYKETLYENVIKVYPEVKIEEMSAYLAARFSKIIKDAIPEESNNSPEVSDEDMQVKILDSYTITEPEKKALLTLLGLNQKAFNNLKHQIDTLLNKQYELMNLSDSEKDEKYKPHLECEIVSLKNSLDKSYSEIENLCTDTIKLVETKKDIHASLGIIISIASNVISDKYNVKCLDNFNYNGFSLMISRFNDNYDKIRRDIDNL